MSDLRQFRMYNICVNCNLFKVNKFFSQTVAIIFVREHRKKRPPQVLPYSGRIHVIATSPSGHRDNTHTRARTHSITTIPAACTCTRINALQPRTHAGHSRMDPLTARRAESAPKALRRAPIPATVARLARRAAEGCLKVAHARKQTRTHGRLSSVFALRCGCVGLPERALWRTQIAEFICSQCTQQKDIFD